MRRLALALMVMMAAAWVIPAGAQAAGLFVLSGSDSSDPTHSISGLISLADGGGEFQNSTSGGAVIAGSGVGPYVYNSGGSGSIRQFSGGTYRTITGSIPAVKSMTVTGRGLVVAIGNKLQYVAANGTRSDVPHGTLTGGDSWVAIATGPDGHIIGWSWNDGWGELWDLNLGNGATTSQDFTGVLNDPLYNNRDNSGTYGAGPVGDAGDLAVDGLGGLWLANAKGSGGTDAEIFYAAPNGSLNSVASHYYKPHITATGDGKAYASTSDYSAPGYITDVYKFPGETKVTSASGKLTKSAIFDLAVDRCYAACSVSGPNILNPGATTQKLTVPKAKTIKLGKKGLKLKLKCSIACTISITGKLTFGKVNSAAGGVKLKKAKFKLKAGKSKTVTIKMSKKQRAKVKRAKRQKRKVVAKLKLVVTSKGVKTVRKPLKLRVK